MLPSNEDRGLEIMDEVVQFLGDESSDFLEIFSDIDENDPLFSNDEGNTSNSTNTGDSDTQTEEEEEGDIEDSKPYEQQQKNLVVPQVSKCYTDYDGSSNEWSSNEHIIPLVESQKKRKLQVPKYEGILPLFQPNLLGMMQNMLPLSNSALSYLPQTQPPTTTAPQPMDKKQKKYLRMMKNRESANKSRMKRKHAMAGLEREVNDLKEEVQKLNQELAATKAENASLKNHNSFLQNLLTKASLPNSAVLESYKYGRQGEVESSGNIPAGGVALFAVIFLCYMYVGSPNEDTVNYQPSNRNGRTLLSTKSLSLSNNPYLNPSYEFLLVGFAVLSVYAITKVINYSLKYVRTHSLHFKDKIV